MTVVLPDTCLVFIGYSRDAAAEAEMIYGLRQPLNDELRKYRELNPRIKFANVQFWKWDEDASHEPGGQQAVVEPFLRQAVAAVFVFKDRIGPVGWDELDRCRKMQPAKPVIVMFPDQPSDLGRLADPGYVAAWSDLLNKKKELVEDWKAPDSRAVTPVADYSSIGQLQELVLTKLKKTLHHLVTPAPANLEDDAKPGAVARFPPAYRAWLVDNYQHLDADKLCGGHMLPLNLPEIFIPLYTHAVEPGIKRPEEMAGGEKNPPVDLEKLLTRRDVLVIEGHPGSGKTTLLKHITYCLAREDGRCAVLEPLRGFLPLLIFLKDLNGYFQEPGNKRELGRDAFDIIRWHDGTKLGQTAGPDTMRAFIEQGRAVILLDGLDELQPEYRDAAVSCFADLRLKYSGNKLVFTGRPHGLTGAAVTRFPAAQVKIDSLTGDQIAAFVKKWFGYFYSGTASPGGRTAEALISDIQTHPAIGQLIDNPLMLTAICILYHDQKELPGQRAVLYTRFIENMLCRRFGGEAEKVRNYLKTLARDMHLQRKKTIDEVQAVRVLMRIYKRDEKEDEHGHAVRAKAKFQEIEAKCGLLKLKPGGYEFWHLTFQEFLCADYIADNATGAVNAIDDYWEDDWFAEVVELYISFISMASKATANTIVRDALNRPEPARWLKAAAALYDIPPDRRDEEVVVPLARRKLMSVFQTGRKVSRKTLAEAGELLGWLGDPRDLQEFVEIPGGVYELEGWNRPVTLSQSFRLGKYPVTNQWFAKFVLDGGYTNEEYLRNCWSDEGRAWREKKKILAPEYWHDRTWRCPNAPVVGVSWREAEAFGHWLTMQRNDGWTYRLPSEAEWQAAAAEKEKREYPWGAGIDATRCNYGGGKHPVDKTSAAGIFDRGRTPDFAIYDLAGNVWEWCADWHAEYPPGEVVDPSGPPSGTNRVIRGGSWGDPAGCCRAAFRSWNHPGRRIDDLGFRLAAGRSGVEPSQGQEPEAG